MALFVCTSPKLLFGEVRYVRAGDDLQAALNAARPGDELRLAPNTTFTGNFVLPVTTDSSTITVRTDLPDQSLPGPRQRVTPSTAANFARIVSPNSAAALATAPGAHDWRLMFLEFPSTKEGYGDIIQLGDGSSAQTTTAQVPYNIVLDHVYVHGDPIFGQKRGVALNARDITIRASYISDIKAVGVDSQAIGGWNGPGPFTIENNYLEAAGEVVLLGGSDPYIPDLVSSDVIVRFNHITRPMSWKDPVVPSPSDVSAVATDGGRLTAGVYGYRVVACRPSGAGSIGTSMPSDEVTAVASSGAVRVSWTPVDGATEYRVYVRTPAGATTYWTVTDTSFTHTGPGGTSGAVPTTATMWQVKNLFELKNARRVRVEYNLFENNWQAAQTGYAILFTPRNQDGRCTWCVVELIDFTHNIVRNVAGGFSITGYDSDKPSQQSNSINIQDNLLYNITTSLGGPGWGVLMGEAVRDITFDRNTFDFDGTTVLYAYGRTGTGSRLMTGFKYTNNASPHGEYGVNGAEASTGTLTFQMYFPEAVFTGNWLAGGSSSRYPTGNTFQEPFDAGLNKLTASSADAPGADVSRLVPLTGTIAQGLLPGNLKRPNGLRVTAGGK